MVEYYEDVNCNKLVKSEVYLADGACHYFTLGTMKIWTAEDKSMAALLVSGSCDSDDWSVFMNLNASVNTGACVPRSDYQVEAVKYVLRGDSLAPTTPMPTQPSTPIPTTSAGMVSVRIGNDDPSCEKPSTATIQEGGCTDRFACTAYDHVGGWSNVTYYGLGTCSSSRETFLRSTFADSPVFMIEHYEDSNCNKLTSSEVYRADGECHYFTLGVMKIWVSGDKKKAALLTSSYCESNAWSVSMDLNVTINTGACIANDEYASKAVKYVLMPDGTSQIPSSRDHGRALWPGRRDSLCTRNSNSCHGSTLIDLGQKDSDFWGISNQLLKWDQWVNSLLHTRNFGHYTDQEQSMLSDRLLQNSIMVNHRLFDQWKASCTRGLDSSHSQELLDCRCAHNQLIHGISTARRIQRIAGRHGLDAEWCNLLVQRERMLYQGTRSVLSDLCDRDLSGIFFKKRRAFLDTILC
ncbi:hypothetical protein PInf_010331 [Phytophthora infestans]|nr:hypothetical protein PInf_010331 [Phytophthora infestans]